MFDIDFEGYCKIIGALYGIKGRYINLVDVFPELKKYQKVYYRKEYFKGTQDHFECTKEILKEYFDVDYDKKYKKWCDKD